jgi:hypothetical protein
MSSRRDHEATRLARSSRSLREEARLLEKIRQAGAPVPDGARLQATHATRAMRSEGGAVWVLVGADGRPTSPLVCSQWPRRLLLARPVVAWCERGTGDWIVAPDKP